MSTVQIGAPAAPPDVELDLEQELILVRRFEDAMADLEQECRAPAAGRLRAHHEFERSWRIATNMRGHMR